MHWAIDTQFVWETFPSQSPKIKEAPVFMMLGKLQMWKCTFPSALNPHIPQIVFQGHRRLRLYCLDKRVRLSLACWTMDGVHCIFLFRKINHPEDFFMFYVKWKHISTCVFSSRVGLAGCLRREQPGAAKQGLAWVRAHPSRGCKHPALETHQPVARRLPRAQCAAGRTGNRESLHQPRPAG